MRVMVFVKGDMPANAPGPNEAMLAAMGTFNEELANAGILLAADGLRPSALGKRVKLRDNKPSVTDGPFAEAKELVGGYWVWRVKSIDEAVEWVKKAPFPPNFEVEIEIRPISEEADFGDAMTPAIRTQQKRLRERIAKNQ